MSNVDSESSPLDNGNQGEEQKNKVILCLYFKRIKLAAACFKVDSSELLFMNSVVEDDSRASFYLQRIYDEVKPTLVLANTSASKLFLKHLQNIIFADETNSVTLNLIGPKHFNYEVCKEKVQSLKVMSENGNDIRSKYFVMTSINLDDDSLISAIGALIHYLETNLTSKLQVKNILPVSLNNLILLSEETLIDINVFNPSIHPSGFKWNWKNHSDRFSLYSMMQGLCGKITQPFLRLFLSRPTSDVKVIQERLELIRFFVKPVNNQYVINLRRFLHSLSPISVLLSKISCLSLRGSHWKIIYKNIHFAARLAEMCKENENEVPYLKMVAQLLTPGIYRVANYVYNTIDFEAMEMNDKFVVKYGVKKELDDAKTKFALLPKTIQAIIPYEFSILPDYIHLIHIVYIPELQFLLQIPYWREDLTKKDLELPNLEYKFSASNVAYYKSKRCKEMDRLLGDPLLEIMEEESCIILQLLKCIGEHLPALTALLKKLVELDCLTSLSVLSKEYNYTEPKLTEDNSIEIIKGRHPLLCLNGEAIENDFKSNQDSSVKVLYGANSSGKTVYLKQNALIVYMAHLGSFVPAEKALICPIDHIFGLFLRSESVVTGMSAFMFEVANLCSAAAYSTKRSLVLLDEFGLATDESSSFSIVRAVLTYFTKLPTEKRPHFILSTHHDFTELFHLVPLGLKIFAMDYVIHEGKVTFPFTVREGVFHTSFALEVAAACGMNEETIHAAKLVLKWLKCGQHGLPPKLQDVKIYLRGITFLKKFCTIKIRTEKDLKKLQGHVITVLDRLLPKTKKQNFLKERQKCINEERQKVVDRFKTPKQPDKNSDRNHNLTSNSSDGFCNIIGESSKPQSSQSVIQDGRKQIEDSRNNQISHSNKTIDEETLSKD